MLEQAQVTVIYPDGTEKKIWTLKGKTARETLALAGMDIKGSCGGRGTCGKCKMRISGHINEPSDNEREHLLPEEIKRGERIACYCTIEGETQIWLDYVGSQDMSPAFKTTALNLNPTAYTREVFIPGRDKEKPVPIMERLQTVLSPLPLELSRENLNLLSKLDRKGRPALELNALVFQNRVKYVGRESRSVYGIALDIGTTSLMAALVDLQNGQVAGICSRTNMQRVYGENVLSRVSYCLENDDGLGNLQQIIINNINSMIEELLGPIGSANEDIYKLSVVGNPVMLHLFLGLDVSGFATVPYGGLFKSEVVYRAGVLGLNINPEAEVIILPQAGGFVGADTIACLVTLETVTPQRYLMIDIGTNGELVLKDRDKIWAASAAAGPAFEGEGITCGMRAGQGAVDRVWLEKGILCTHVIGQTGAKGICGSAVIDLVASLIDMGQVEINGRIIDQAQAGFKMGSGTHGSQLILMEEDKTDTGLPLVFTQEDIRQVQLAKAAIRSGIDILLTKAGLNYKDLDHIYLAGAFGNYLDPFSCIKVGMLPPLEEHKITNIGNAAAEGAAMVLTSDVKRNYARVLGKIVECVELAEWREFQDIFMHNIDFPPNG
ncbi:MAG TPA: ASKHA domain-containing protein [Syntrophomonadaceae bacterium]|nr:ASKHA domain-containing protein [Syntrophomonadaceae bacterium]